MDLNICSFNVKGLASKQKRTQIFQWLKQKQFSICLLQETHCKQSDELEWQKMWGNKIFLSGESTNSQGIGIFINTDSEYKIIEYKEYVKGRLQLLHIEIMETQLVIVNIYGPNTDDVQFYSILDNIVHDYNDHSLILGGDFNTVLDYDLDKLNGRTNTQY